MAISQCLSGPRTLVQSGHRQTGTMLSCTAWYLTGVL